MVDTYSLVPRLSGSFSHPTLPGHEAKVHTYSMSQSCSAGSLVQ